VVALPILNNLIFDQFTPQAMCATLCSPTQLALPYICFPRNTLPAICWPDYRLGSARGLLGNPNITWIFTPPASLFAPTNVSQYTGVFFVAAVDNPIPSAYESFVTAMANRTTAAYSGLGTDPLAPNGYTFPTDLPFAVPSHLFV